MAEILERRQLGQLPEHLKSYALAKTYALASQVVSPVVTHTKENVMKSISDRFHEAFGANIGNLTPAQQAAYLAALTDNASPGPTAPQGAGVVLQDAVPTAQQLNDPHRLANAVKRLTSARGTTVAAQGGEPTGTAPSTKPGTAANDPNRFINAVKRRIAGRTNGGN